MSVQKQFIEEVKKPAAEINVELCALLFAGEIKPDTNARESVLALDRQVNTFLSRSGISFDRAQSNSDFLTNVVGGVLGYRGDTLEYFSADNSLFDSVIENRLGIPISLAAIYISVGQRLGIDVHGVGFPGHYLIRITEPDGSGTLVDPFSHSKVSQQQIEGLVKTIRQSAGGFDDGWLANAHPHDMLVRMFENLKRTFLNVGELSAAQHCLDYQLILRPEDPALLSQLEALLKHSGDAARSGKGASRLH